MKAARILSFILLLSVTSCTIIQEYHFNKDFSGTSKLSIDMASFMQMMAGMDSTGNSTKSMRDSLDLVFSESSKKLEEFGIKNIKLDWVDNSDILYMTYDFDNKAINASNAQNAALSNTISTEPHTYFSRNGKKLIYKGPKSDKESPKEMESMSEYYKYSLIFTFDRKVKKMDNNNYTLSPDKKKVELSGSMLKILKSDFNSDITFTLK
jgi:phosphoribosyl-AMP cyclohydrolase